METALRDAEEFSCFVELLRLSHDYDRLHAWMWLKVIDNLRVTRRKDEAAIKRQIRHLWNTYLSENGEKAFSVEVERILEWGDHIQDQLQLIEALIYADLQRAWTEYQRSPARKRVLEHPKVRRSLSERLLNKRAKKSVSPKLGRRASETRLLHNSVEIRREYFDMGNLIRVA